MPLTFDKAGKTLEIISDGTAKIPSLCKKDCCRKKKSFDKFRVLPCGCHGLIVECTCRIHDKECKRCGKVYVQSLSSISGEKFYDWYEVKDPHKSAGVSR